VGSDKTGTGVEGMVGGQPAGSVHGGRRVKLSCLGGGVTWVVVTGVEA
jgi:hypothetical protein